MPKKKVTEAVEETAQETIPVEKAPAQMPRRQGSEDLLELNDLERGVTREDSEEAKWGYLAGAVRRQQILTGIVSAGMTYTENGMPIVPIDFEGLCVKIPVREMTLIEWPEDEPIPRSVRVQIGRMLGATIDFIPAGVDFKERVAIGSRKAAMLQRQKRYYASGRVKPGILMACRVLTVGNNTMMVEACGVDTEIYARNVSWEWFSDIADLHSTGDLVVATQTLTFYNTPEGGLQIIKSDADTGKRLSGVVFEIRKMDGEIIGTYTTDANGVIRIPNAKSGWYTIMERKAANGYRLDAMTPTQACVKDGETTTVEITNQRMCSIMIHKVDANTGKGLYGVKFVIYDSGKNPIMEVETDQDGYAYVRDELAPGKYFIRELEAASGYIRDEQYKTVYVEAGKCTQIEWENSAVTGQIQVRKYATDDNSVTGQHAGTALEGAVFEISQARSGSVVGYIVTDARGVAASGPLPLGRYYVTEVSAPKYYQLSGEKMEAEIEYPNQIIKLSSYNKPAKLGVTIKKTGNYEVQPGQSMSYHFSGIANTSNVALNSFFWHDRIPTDATRAMSISTGTYNQRLYYKVTFKTNLNDYRTLASNLLTANNYSLSLNAAALGLVQGEYVTDVRFEFGTVPSGFSSVVKPTMRVQVLGTVSNGYQIINRADVGGKYLNEWQTAKSPWITTVRRFNTTPLPKTGY